jgi:hypothetical protein
MEDGLDKGTILIYLDRINIDEEKNWGLGYLGIYKFIEIVDTESFETTFAYDFISKWPSFLNWFC